MTVEPGTTLGHYRVVEKIGEGGMGVVWKALDTTLDREVAVKVLPQDLSADPERLARFEREAKLLASLNHPNIATIFGLHSGDGAPFLSMELLDGEDLATRLSRGPLPIQEAMRIARETVAALETAHENGIVHRDLKPANIQLTAEGQVKVLDFGLAKAFTPETASGSISASLSPTVTSAGTVAGVILGTAAYMSPEQAKGKAVDRRADVWALGVVLYEMLTGKSLFVGESVSEILAAVILKEADLGKLPSGTPARLRELLRRCLCKDPRKRLRDIGEARILIDEAIENPHATIAVDASGVAVAVQESRSPLLAAGVTAAVFVLAIAAWWMFLRPEPDRPVLRMNVELSGQTALAEGPGAAFAISDDGSQVAYVMGDPPTLHVRELKHLEGVELSGTQGAANPFFSPDGEWIGFFAGGKLKKVSTSGGAPLTLCDVQVHRGADWGPDDTIVLGPSTTTPIRIVPAAGGEPEDITTIDKEQRERSHRWPHFLPGGRRVLFTSQRRASDFDEASLEVVDLDSKERTVVHRGGSHGRYVPSGHLVFVREGTMFTVPFDVNKLETTGSPAPVVEDVKYDNRNGGAGFAVSRNGTLLYQTGAESSSWSSSLVRVDRTGNVSTLWSEGNTLDQAALSPDGRYVAMTIRDQGGGGLSDIWVRDLEREVTMRLTFGESWNWMPSWTPDGTYVTFSSDRSGSMCIYRKPADGSGEAEQLTEGEGMWGGASWTPDGETLVFTRFEDSNDIAAFTPGSDEKPSVFLKTDKQEARPQVSPDGRWVAYRSNATERNEIYVRPFPGPGGRWQISSDGGNHPLWSRDGRELFFLKGNTLFAVPVSGENGRFVAGKPTELFTAPREIGPPIDVGLDGKSFVMMLRDDGGDEEDDSPQRAVVTMVLNWFEEL